MPKRRRWGRIRKLPSGRYQARYPGPDSVLYPAPHTFPTYTDADIWLTDKETEIRRNGWQDPNAGTELLGDYVDRWLAERDLAPRTMQSYEAVVRLHIRPYLGNMELQRITLPVVRSWRARLTALGRGESVRAKAYRLLKAILNTAVEDEKVPRNPCRIKGAGVERRKQFRIPTVKQVTSVADELGSRWRALVLLTAFGALRWGEVVALRQKDIDLDTMTVRVERSFVELGGRLIEGPPKSDAGCRTVHLPIVRACLAKAYGPVGRTWPQRMSVCRFTGWKPATIQLPKVVG